MCLSVCLSVSFSLPSVNKWRRQHGPLDGKIFQHLGKFLQVDPMLLSQYEKGQNGKDFDPQAGMTTVRRGGVTVSGCLCTADVRHALCFGQALDATTSQPADCGFHLEQITAARVQDTERSLGSRQSSRRSSR